MARILLGANYYPEDWNEENIDSDIVKMKECGFNVVTEKNELPQETLITIRIPHRT